jgi:hypothetical protein
MRGFATENCLINAKTCTSTADILLKAICTQIFSNVINNVFFLINYIDSKNGTRKHFVLVSDLGFITTILQVLRLFYD